MNARPTLVPLVAALAWLLPPGLRAAAPAPPPLTQLDLRTWNPDHGVLLGTVRAMLQGREGYLWLGTDAGLARFDGVRFVTFDTRNTPALRSNFVHALCQDRAGNLWLGTSGGGVSRLDPAGRWTTWTTADGLPSDTLDSLAEDPADGSLWLGTRGGPTRFHAGRFTAYGADAGLDRATVWALAFDRAGQLWVGTADGLCLREGERFRRFGAAEGLPSATVLSLAAGADGELWVGTRAGLARRRRGGGDDPRFEAVPASVDGAPEDSVYALIGDRAGNLWLGGRRGVKRRAPDGTVSGLPLAGNFAGANVCCFQEDAEGNVWVGTADGGGLARLKAGKFGRLTAADGLPDDQVYMFARDPAGRVWIATRGGLACREPGEPGRVRRMAFGPELDGRSVGTLHVDRRGVLWFSVGDQGEVCCLDTADPDAAPQRFNFGPGAESLRVRAIAEDAADHLWLATSEGLRGWRGGRPVRPEGGPAAVLANTFCRWLHRDRTGHLWIGTRDDGLFRLAPDGALRSWKTRDGLSSDKVQVLHEDQGGDGTLWLGTLTGGLCRLAPDGRVTGVCRPRDGLLDDMVLGLLEDGVGNLWLNCDRGLFRVNKAELNEFCDGKRPRVEGTAYGVGDGMRTTLVAGNGTPLALAEPGPGNGGGGGGRLWFPTVGGAVLVDPARLTPDPRPPPVRIETLTADGRPVDLHPAGDAPVRIAPGAGGRLDFAFTALSLTAPERVRIRYRLEPYDRDWNEADEPRAAHYTNLPPNRYTFRVRAANPDGVWSPVGAAVAFQLLPRFYQTAWFQALCVVGVALGAAGVFRSRQRRLRREFAAVLAERGRLARELHDTLAQGLIAAGQQLELAGRPREGGALPDPVEHHLQTAHHIVRQTLGEARAMVASLHGSSPSAARKVSDLAAALGTLVAELRVRAGGTNLHFDDRLPAAWRERTLPAETASGFALICREALTNAIKHAAARSVRLELFAPGPDRLGATVGDDGVGFDPAITGRGDGEGGGFGLRSMREHADALRAALSVRSAPGSGTRVQVEIALPVGANLRVAAPDPIPDGVVTASGSRPAGRHVSRDGTVRVVATGNSPGASSIL